MKAIYFEGENGNEVVEKDIPADLLDLANKKKVELIAALAEIDPIMEEYYLNEDMNIPIDILKK